MNGKLARRSTTLGIVVAAALGGAFCAPKGAVFRSAPPPQSSAPAPSPDDSTLYTEPENVGPVEFWVLGPLPIDKPGAASGIVLGRAAERPGLDRDYLSALGGEPQVSIGEGATVSFGTARVTAQRVTVDRARPELDFVKLFGEDTDDKVAYAYADWVSPRAAQALALFGSDDAAVVWFNGERVHRVVEDRALSHGQDQFELIVKSGRNRLLVKVDNGRGGWGFALSLLDESGRLRKRALDVRRHLESVELGPDDGQHLLGSTFPEIHFRSPDAARLAFGHHTPKTRWFGPDLSIASRPRSFGRYQALVEIDTKDGYRHRRVLTFAKLERVLVPRLPSPPHTSAPPLTLPPLLKLGEAEARELTDHIWRGAVDHLAAGEGRAILELSLARIEAKRARSSGLATLGNPPEGDPAWLGAGYLETAEAGLALRVAIEQRKIRQLSPPAPLESPAPVLKPGSEHGAGFRPGTLAKLRALLQAWAKDDPNGFVALVARRGTIVLHEGFNGFAKDERFFPASIAKTVAGLLFARAVDQGLIGFDQPLSQVFPEFAQPHTKRLTFRHLFQHVSGLTGHRSHGGLTNPYLDNAFLLEDFPFVEPLERFEYGGDAMNLAGKALELVTGRTVFRLLHENLHRPLGEDVRQYDLGTGDAFTATYVAKLGQLYLQDGAYGAHRFFSPGFLKTLYPQPIAETLPGFADREAQGGIGLDWTIDPQGPREKGVLGPNVIGHRSATGCLFRVALDHELVIVVGRNRFSDYSTNEAWAEKLGSLLASAMLPSQGGGQGSSHGAAGR